MADLRSGVAVVIADWRPRTVGAEAAGFARQVVAAAAPQTPARARALLFAASKLGAFGVASGLECRAEVLLHPSVIERFVLVGATAWSAASRRTIRTNLLHLQRCLAVGAQPSRLSREHAKPPYAGHEIAAYLGLADAQPTVARRMRAQALICLGAGAGLIGADLRQVRGADVAARSGGLVVEVHGRRTRTVPVLAHYHDRLVRSARFFGGGFMVGVDPDRHNVTTPLIASLSGGTDLPRLQTARLRSTWLATVADIIGLRAFLDAAGISCSQRLGDIIAGLGALEEADAVRILGASR